MHENFIFTNMFILVEMSNVTRITPDLFNIKLNDAIASELNRKLANKVSCIMFSAITIKRIFSGGAQYWVVHCSS